MIEVKQKLTVEVDLQHSLNLISELTGCGTSQKELAQAVGLSQGDFGNRKKRGTLGQYLIDWGAERDISAEELFPELKRLKPGQDPPQAQAPEDKPHGHDLVRLPRGDTTALSPLEADILEKAIVVLRAQDEGKHFAQSLVSNVESYYKGVLQATSHVPEPVYDRKIKAS